MSLSIPPIKAVRLSSFLIGKTAIATTDFSTLIFDTLGLGRWPIMKKAKVQKHKSKQNLRVVLDTNSLHGSWWLEGPNFLMLKRFIKAGMLEVLIPEVVVHEVVNNYSQELRDAQQASVNLAQLVPRIKVPRIDVSKEAGRYNKRLPKMLKSLGAVTVSHEHLGHRRFVHRAIQRRKPFGGSDRGYRDALIWATVADALQDRPIKTYFITKNWKDFCSPGKTQEPHADLRADLMQIECDPNLLVITPSIMDFVNSELKPIAATVSSAIISQIRAGKYRDFKPKAWFMENKDDIASLLSQWISSQFSDPDSFDDAELAHLEDPTRIEIVDVYPIDDDNLYIELLAVAEVSIEGFAFKSNIVSAMKDHDLHVSDWDWNRHVASVSTHKTVPIRVTLQFNVLDGHVESFEVNQPEFEWGWCNACGTPIPSDGSERCGHCGISFIEEANDWEAEESSNEPD